MRARHLLLLAFPALALAPSAALASPLSDAAAALPEGAWVELPTENIAALGFGEHSGTVTAYSQSAAWDSATDTLHFIGLDHAPGSNMHYFTFVAETNAWTDHGEMPVGAHGYEHIAVDATARRVYHRVYALGTGPDAHRILERDLDGPIAWSEITPFPDSYAQVAIAMVFVPGLGLVVYNCGEENGQIAIMDASGTWTEIRGFGGTSRYSCIAEYSAARDVVVLGGGGDDAGRLWRMDRDGTVTELGPTPIGTGTSYAGEGHQGNVTADPNTGDFLVIGEGQLWALDPSGTGTWSRLPDPPLTHLYDDPHMISAALDDHGVALYVTCRIYECHVFLYRHAPGSGTVVDVDGGPRRVDGGVLPGSDAGGVVPGRDGGASGSDAAVEPPPAESSSCSCRAAGARTLPSSAIFSVLVLALALTRRRCRYRPTPRAGRRGAKMSLEATPPLRSR